MCHMRLYVINEFCFNFNKTNISSPRVFTFSLEKYIFEGKNIKYLNKK